MGINKWVTFGALAMSTLNPALAWSAAVTVDHHSEWDWRSGDMSDAVADSVAGVANSDTTRLSIIFLLGITFWA